MTKPHQLMRLCSSCGAQKSLSAFLQLNTDGATYGTLCSDCRQTATSPKKDSDERDSSSSGLEINAKAKIAIDISRKELSQTIKEQDQAEIREKDKTQSDLIEKKEKIETLDKSRLFENKSEKKKSIKSDSFNHKTREFDFKKKAEQLRQEYIMTSTDMTFPFLVALFHEVRYQSSLFQHFKAWLGGSAPITKFSTLHALDRIYQQNAVGKKQETSPGHPQEVDPLINYIEKNWINPSKRK